MQAQPLNNVATTDAYSDATTIVRPSIRRLRFQVSNAAIFYQTADPSYGIGAPVWEPERQLIPGLYGFEHRCNGVRVRSAVAGVPARVSIDFEAGS
jgi:hypothetical protein